MSGGECQRVAIARAIVNNPGLLLADEPTGNLDSRTGEQIIQIFHELRAGGITIVLVTHEGEIAAQADRMIHMIDGRIVEDTAADNRGREEAPTMPYAARKLTHPQMPTPTAERAPTRLTPDAEAAS